MGHSKYVLRILSLALLSLATSSVATELPVPTIVRNAIDAVVTVVVLDRDANEIASGSGFFVTGSGLLVTNEHVIRDGHSFLLKRRDGSFFVANQVLAIDTRHDIALLQAKAERVTFLPLSHISQPELGSDVVAIGSPLGLEASISTGIVSGLRKYEGATLIQTTAPISPGSSGGPLLNREGQVVGVTRSYLEGGQNLNFAVPVAVVRALLEPADVRASGPQQSSSSSQRTLKLPDLSKIQWQSLAAARDTFSIRQSGAFLYTERRLPAGTRPDIYERCELRLAGDRWTGSCGMGSLVPCGVNSLKYCVLQFGIELSLVSAHRIEGRYEFVDKFDCARCTVQGSVWKDFVWLPAPEER